MKNTQRGQAQRHRIQSIFLISLPLATGHGFDKPPLRKYQRFSNTPTQCGPLTEKTKNEFQDRCSGIRRIDSFLFREEESISV
jgi:hypothetical protein